MATREAEILDQLRPTLTKHLSLDIVASQLKSAGVLTEFECQRLAAGLNNRKEENVKVFVEMLKSKGPTCASALLSVLRESVSVPGKPPHGHMQLIEVLQRRLRGGNEDGVQKTQNGLASSTHSTFTPASGVLHHYKEASNSTNIFPNFKDLPGLSREPVQLINYESFVSQSKRESQKGIEDVCILLVKDSKGIRQTFTDYVMNVCELLENSPSATVQKIQLALQYLASPTTPQTTPEQRRTIFDSRSSVTKGTSIPGILSALAEYSSWFNYELVSYLAQRFGGEEGRQLAHQYETQLKRYFQRLVFQCPPFTTNEQCVPHGFEELVVMVDWDLSHCSLQDISIFKSTLCHMLNIQPCAFVLRSILGSPTQLSWALPSSHVPETISSASSKTEALSDEGVLTLTMGSKVIECAPTLKSKVKASPQRKIKHRPRPLSLPPTSTATCTSSHPPLYSNVQVQRTGSLQARGVGPVAGSRSTNQLNQQPVSNVSQEPLNILQLAQSPVAINESYSQFYYSSRNTHKDSDLTRDKEAPQSPHSSEEEPELKKLLVPQPQCSLSAIKVRAIQAIDVGSSPSPLQPPQFESSSAENLTDSPVMGIAAIRVAAFKSKSADIGSPMSASIVNIGKEVDNTENPVGPSAAQPRDNQPAANGTNMAVNLMLSAACEAQRKRGRKQRVDFETARRLTEVHPTEQESLHVKDNSFHEFPESASDKPPTLHEENKQMESSLQCPEGKEAGLADTAQPLHPSRPSEEPCLSQDTSPQHSTPIHDKGPHPNIPNESRISLQSAYSHSTVSSMRSRSTTPLWKSPDGFSSAPEHKPPSASLKPMSSDSELLQKSVGFLWRLLGRASKQYPANVYVAAIATTHKWEKDELPIRKGQQFKALFRSGNRIYAINHQNAQGYVPYQYCRVSKKYYGMRSRMVQLSYSQVYIQSPDGIDIGHRHSSFVPRIEMIAIQDQQAESPGDLCVKSGEKMWVFYCDDTWVYALTESMMAGFIPRACCRLTRRTQNLYHEWIRNNTPFQADFVVRFSQSPPPILKQNTLRASVEPIACNERHGDKVGKIMTVTRSFQPRGTGATITKGLRLRVVKASGELALVTTQAGSVFWIPFSFLQPAAKVSWHDFDSRPTSRTDAHRLLDHTRSQPAATHSHEQLTSSSRPLSLHGAPPSTQVDSSNLSGGPFSSSQPALSSERASVASLRSQNVPSQLPKGTVLPSYPSDETLGYV